jgi:hypothetical protein
MRRLLILTLIVAAGLAGCAAGTATAAGTVRETITTPYVNGTYGKGSAGVGLQIDGSRGMGGEPLQIDDTEPGGGHAPEVWVAGGNLYVGYHRGWLGGAICIDNDLKTSVCLTLRDIRFLHRLEAR